MANRTKIINIYLRNRGVLVLTFDPSGDILPPGLLIKITPKHKTIDNTTRYYYLCDGVIYRKTINSSNNVYISKEDV